MEGEGIRKKQGRDKTGVKGSVHLNYKRTNKHRSWFNLSRLMRFLPPPQCNGYSIKKLHLKKFSNNMFF